MSNKLNIRDVTYSSLFTALISVLSYITIPLPFSPVPITGQSLAIMLAGIVLTTKQTAFSIGAFLLLGAIGVPVFSGGRAGLGVFAGPSGGYLIGYFIGGIIISLLLKKENNYFQTTLSTIFGGIIIVHLLGVLWLNYVTEMGLQQAIISGSLPFIPGDLFKAAVATIIGVKINNQLKESL